MADPGFVQGDDALGQQFAEVADLEDESAIAEAATSGVGQAGNGPERLTSDSSLCPMCNTTCCYYDVPGSAPPYVPPRRLPPEEDDPFVVPLDLIVPGRVEFCDDPAVPFAEGCHCKVYAGMYSYQGQSFEVAIKVPYNCPIETICSEARIGMGLDHKNVIRTYGLWHWQRRGKVCLITERMQHGSLRHLLNAARRHNDTYSTLESDPRAFIVQIASAMEYVHANGHIHNDLRAENVFIQARGHQRRLCQQFDVKIGDFGCAQTLDSREFYAHVVTENDVVPYCSVAPEVLDSNREVAVEHSDVWSFGVLMWEFFSQRHPWEGVDGHLILHHIQAGATLEYLRIQSTWPRWARYWIERCLQVEPKNRPRFTCIVKGLQPIEPSILACFLTVIGAGIYQVWVGRFFGAKWRLWKSTYASNRILQWSGWDSGFVARRVSPFLRKLLFTDFQLFVVAGYAAISWQLLRKMIYPERSMCSSNRGLLFLCIPLILGQDLLTKLFARFIYGSGLGRLYFWYYNAVTALSAGAIIQIAMENFEIGTPL